jgi:protein O-GlcNAc transferase
MLIAPENPTVHYNQAFVLAGTNRLEIALVHYKLALTLNEAYLNFEKASVEAQDLLLNTYNGLANLFRGVKQWPQSLFYLSQAIKYRPKDPDINNQLGTVYTELRRTDLAEACYQLAIDNINQACISKNQSKLLADIYLNYGHLFSYNGDNYGAIESYNTSLKYHPGYILPFQNKIMNLNYISDYLESGYISQQHRLVERLFSPPKSKFSRTPQSFLNQKIRIGLVSGDFVEHPVSFFISTFLKYHDSEKYQVICYTNTAMTSTLADQTKATFKNSEGLSAELLADLIYNDKILILFDLAGHTAHNRLDVFALKPAPIQVSYIGYPFTTGLSQMDYRITDTVCEGGEMDISQKDYTEQLITMPGCFLSYDPTVKVLPEIRDDNNFDQRIAFGCFNRLNKITPDVIKLCEQVLQVTENSIFYFKTKALLNDSIKEKFLSQFSSDVRDRIKVLECTLSHEQHLSEYNKVDYAIDTFPYSGTTTSCEALAMGVPVFTLLRPGCHASNVTASILKYTSNELFERYTASDCETLLKKVGMMTASRKTGDRLTYKKQLRDTFLKGSVCDGPGFVVKFQNLLESLLLKYSA